VETTKLVVTCFLSPQDTVLAAKLTRTQPILSPTMGSTVADNNVVDATVTLSKGETSVGLVYDAKLGYYRISAQQLPILADETYTLRVQTPLGEVATSSCRIPGPVPLLSVILDSLPNNQFGQSAKRFFVRAHWQDPAGPTNYYQLMGNAQYPYQDENSKPRLGFTTLYFDNLVSSLQTDHGQEGGAMVSERDFFRYGSFAGATFGDLFQSVTVNLHLLNTDQGYYQYQRAVAQQAYNGDNPFAEPLPIPSNIQGALGCFGGYNRSIISVRLR
jgi:hypothetical protein